MMIATTCKHFNGIQHGSCRAGIVYKAVRHPAAPASHNLPCFTDRNPCGAVCSSLALPTAEEAAAEEARINLAVERACANLSPCCGASVDERQVIRKGEHKGHGPRFCSACNKLAFQV